MRIFAIPNVYVDCEASTCWTADSSYSDDVDDMMIHAGNLSDSLARLECTLSGLAARFPKLP